MLLLKCLTTLFLSEMSSLDIALTLVRGPGRLSAIAPRLAPLLLFFRTAKYMVKRSKIEKLGGAGCDDVEGGANAHGEDEGRYG